MASILLNARRAEKTGKEARKNQPCADRWRIRSKIDTNPKSNSNGEV
jgi:hypothetical protein